MNENGGFGVSIRELTESFLEKNKNKAIFFHKKGYRTYSANGEELREKIGKLRGFFRGKNIRKGDRIILFGSSCLEWIAVYFASILEGVVVVPLDILTDKILLKKIQGQVGAKAIFQDKELARLSSREIRTYYFEDLDRILENVGLVYGKAEIEERDILEIMYTSGTTGEPKGVVLTYGNVNAGINYAVRAVPLYLGWKMLNLLPLSHIFGQIYGLFSLMHYNCEVFFSDTIQASKIVSFIRNKRINGVVLVPGILNGLKKELEGKSVMRELGVQFLIVGVGGAPLDIELERWWRRKVMFFVQGYGLTETSSVVSANKLGASRTGSVGKIADGVEAEIGENNEILVRGKNVTPRYYQNEEKTREAFENGWFKTGDIGEIRGEYLYIKERKKDVIVTAGGLKAYPIDIENILNKIDGVKESCVIERDKKVHAILSLSKNVNTDKIIKQANEKLLGHQKIMGYSIWERDFPKTPVGKIKKFIVKEELERKEKEGRKEHKYESALYNVIDRVLKPGRKIVGDAKLVELGMDSLKRVELVSEIERKFGVRVDEMKLDNKMKVKELEKTVGEKAKVERVRFREWSLCALSRAIRFVGQKIASVFIRIFTETEYYGLENLKNIKGQVIFASNHQSAWDAPVIVKKIEQRVAIPAFAEFVFGLGTKGLWLRISRKIKGFFAALFYNAYAFGEGIDTETSLEFTGEMIDRGHSILIFPEAHRTLDGKIKKFMPGIGYLALNMNVSIVPVKVEGLFEILPADHYVPKFGKSSVKFGKPFVAKNMSYLETTKLIEKKVRAL